MATFLRYFGIPLSLSGLPPPKISSHFWCVSSHMPEPTLLPTLLSVLRHQASCWTYIMCVIMWCQNDAELMAGLTRRSQEQCSYCGRDELLLVWLPEHVYFRDILHAYWRRGKKTKKLKSNTENHKRSPLKTVQINILVIVEITGIKSRTNDFLLMLCHSCLCCNFTLTTGEVSGKQKATFTPAG